MLLRISVLSALLLAGCGRETTPTGYKLSGVGVNPDEIDPSPQNYSGLISYDWIELAGAALPLGLVGLVSFSPVSPSAGDPFEPPYAVVFSSALVMDSDLPATDALFGSFGVAPEIEGRCHTIYEPTSYVSGLADVGSSITIENEDGSSGLEIGRRPLLYPPDVQDVFPTYLALEGYRSTPRYYRTAPDGDSQDIAAMEQAVLSRPNFPFGEVMSLRFPGALPPATATFSSIPVPSGVVELPNHVMPTRPRGVLLSWSGPQYSGDGVELSSGAKTTCLAFNDRTTAPESPADCLVAEVLPEPVEDQYPRGQMYTPPWETDGGITFRWVTSSEDVDETVSITVRFLGPVDENDDSLVEEVVVIPADDSVDRLWEEASGTNQIGPNATPPTEGRRPATACDPDDLTEYLFDDSLEQGGGYVASLQGSPLRTMAEVVCNVGDSPVEEVTVDGVSYGIAEFKLTSDLLEDAMTYGRAQGAMGAIFYFNRTTKTPMTLPPVRDYVGKKRNTSDILVVSNAVQMGRFWVGSDGI